MRKGLLVGTALALLAAASFALASTTGITTQQAQTGTPTIVNLSGVSAAEGTSLFFARADHAHSITGVVPIANGGSGYAVGGGIPVCSSSSSTMTPLPVFTGTSLTCLSVGIQANGFAYVTIGTASQTWASGANAVVKFDTVITDTQSNYSTSTGLFTVPSGKGGVYSVTYNMNWSVGPAVAGVTSAFIIVNGAVKSAGHAAVTNSAQLFTFDSAAAVLLNAADTVGVSLTQNSGGTTTLGVSSSMTIKRMGD